MPPTDQPGKAEIAPVALLILLAPIAVYIGLEYLLKTLSDGSISVPATEFVDNARLVELTGRFKFMAAAAVFGAVSVSVLVIFALDLWANYSARARAYALCGLAVGALVGMVYSVFEQSSAWYFETYHLAGKAFFEAALAVGQVTICADNVACGGARRVYETLSNPINALTSLSAAAALTGMILSLAHRPGSRDPEAEAADLRAAQAVTQRYLFCAGLILTAGMTHLIAWLHWPDALIADAGLRAVYQDMIGALTLYIGVGYSVMILSCYLPVMLIHAHRTERFNRRLSGLAAELPDGQAAALKLPKIEYVQALNAVIAILSPILASAIGSFGQGVLFP